MLTKVRIQNFRLCRDVTLENLGATTALVGRNGAGKSNILQAIAQTARMATSTDAIGLPGPAVASRLPFSAALEFGTVEAQYRYQISILGDLRHPASKPIIKETLEREESASWNPLIKREAGTVQVKKRAHPHSIGGS